MKERISKVYIQGIIKEIFEKDIRKRVKVRKVSVFETVQRYIINNFGAAMSLTNILDDLKKNGCQIRRETLNHYIHILDTIIGFFAHMTREIS